MTKKRLGQYFSGSKVADLLVNICAPTPDMNVIDPMAGNGDMLVAAIRAGVPASNISGIEIDGEVAQQCRERVGQDRIFHGDAFSLNPSTCFGKTSWDLVITNPPYVRYQSMGKFESEGFELKNAHDIRTGVRNIVSTLNHLSDKEKSCFQNIIGTYSGLSDLAVPSWLLCAALVKQGGTLAMVVPESWMNREYALSIKYMLLKLFDIHFMVEDVNAAWFPEALVKTNLLVAQRVALRNDFRNAEARSYRHIKLSTNLVGELSLVDGLCCGGDIGIRAFNWLLVNDIAGDGFESKSVPMSDFVSAMSTSPTLDKLMKKLEPSAQSTGMVSVPSEVRKTLQCEVFPLGIVNLSAWGVQIGQGLRTGANKFFYAELSGNETDSLDLLRVDSLLESGTIAVAQKYLLPALRYQKDVGGEYAVTKNMLYHRLLYIQEDLFDSGGNLREAEDASLASHITASDAVTFKSGGQLNRFRDLSAVKPNIRSGEQTRHWYMLPALAKRHLPQLCVSRVNYKSTRCLLVDEGIVVDANFSTLWTEPREGRIIYAVLALMNSSWVQACLESMATVMGGGALKVDASHLRVLPLPAPNEKLISSLYVLGEQLAHADEKSISDILLKIDEAVLNNGLSVANPFQHRERLQTFVAAKVAARKR